MRWQFCTSSFLALVPEILPASRRPAGVAPPPWRRRPLGLSPAPPAPRTAWLRPTGRPQSRRVCPALHRILGSAKSVALQPGQRLQHPPIGATADGSLEDGQTISRQLPAASHRRGPSNAQRACPTPRRAAKRSGSRPYARQLPPHEPQARSPAANSSQEAQAPPAPPSPALTLVLQVEEHEQERQRGAQATGGGRRRHHLRRPPAATATAPRADSSSCSRVGRGRR